MIGLFFWRLKFFLLFFISFIKVFSSSPYHLVWQCHGCEDEWVKEILKNVSYDEIDDCKCSVFLDNSILILTGPGEKDYRPYIRELVRKGYKFGLIILGDEECKTHTDYYLDARFVLRNYWDEKYSGFPNVLFFPLGYVKNFWNSEDSEIRLISEQRSIFERQYTWAFLGDLKKTTRKIMYNNMKKIPGNYYVHKFAGFLAENALSREEYRDILQETIFIPSPQGNVSLDCFRTYEALESGAIPIVERRSIDYYSKILGEYPFPSVRNWDEVAPLLKQLLKHPDQLENQRKKCFFWWLNYKKTMQDNVKKIIDETMQ